MDNFGWLDFSSFFWLIFTEFEWFEEWQIKFIHSFPQFLVQAFKVETLEKKFALFGYRRVKF
jgi:hypothetical protein